MRRDEEEETKGRRGTHHRGLANGRKKVRHVTNEKYLYKNILLV